LSLICCICFFFQAEDGIRDDLVTGVQTCALPIWTPAEPTCEDRATRRASILRPQNVPGHSLKENLRHHPLVFVIEEMAVKDRHRSEERRVGKESRSGLSLSC